jgi:SAM-dependent methyltransferase
MSSVRDRLADLTDPHRFDLSPQGPGAVLDVGCRSAKIPGAVVHDLNVFPYPLKDSSFEHVVIQDVIEHVQDPIRVMEELHRILRPDGRPQLRTPPFSSALWLPFRVSGIEGLANRFSDAYQKYFASRFPAMNIRAELAAIK